MPQLKIYSNNAIYQKFEVLKNNRNKRYKYQQFFVEGVRNINEAIKNNWDIDSFIFTSERKLSNWATNIIKTVKTEVNYDLTIPLFDQLSDKTDKSELLAIVKMKKDNELKITLSENPLLCLFDRPSNKGNLGTIIRSCDALGCDGLIITGHAVDLYDPEVIVASMGSFFKVPVIRITDQNLLNDYLYKLKLSYSNFITIGTTAHKETNIYDLDLQVPLMLIIGNETEGLSKNYKEICDHLATIPMDINSSASSFNVACAATVLLYEVNRQRKIKSIK